MTKLPPHDIDAEEAVIGSLLIDGDAINQILFLQSGDFYCERNSKVYEACLAVPVINQITVAYELNRRGVLDQCGGAAYLSHLISIVPTSLDIEYYARIVKDLAVYRQLITAGNQITAIGYEAGDVQKDLDRADEILTDLRKQHGRVTIITPKHRAEMLLDRYNRLNNQDGDIALPTGFRDLDKQLGGGFFPGELIVLGGDSGLGKSTLAQNIAINQCQYGNVLFCSGEMTVEGLSDREIAAITGRSVVDIRLGHYDDELYSQIIGEGLGELSTRDVYYYRGMPLTISGVRSAAEEMVVKHGGLRCVVVDYLQKMESPNNEKRYIQLGMITSKLADLAKELNVCVLLLVQLNKDLEYRDNKRPLRSDIYESKRIDQDADVILLLYRVDKYYSVDEWEADYETEGARRGWKQVYGREYPEGIGEIIIAKQRQGGGTTRIVKVVWDKKHQCYRDYYRVGVIE